jgi:glycine hydroxymethyltransferase
MKKQNINFAVHLSRFPRVESLLKQELLRQQDTINLIASECIQSKHVREIMGQPLNKYSEGEPFKKYYQGCDIVSEMEAYTIELVKEVFKEAAYVNVQPHSGNDANIAIITGLLNPGDKILSPHLTYGGGHLSHGAPVTVIGKYFNVMQYNAEESGWYDYNKIDKLADEHKPKIIIGGTSAYSRHIDFAKLRQIADNVGAILLADVSHYLGLIVAGLYPNPLKHAHILTSTTHKTFLGPKGAIIACTDDKNTDGEKLSFYIQRAIFPHFQGGPAINNILSKAVAFEQAKLPTYKNLMQLIIDNACALSKALQDRNVNVFTKGTDTHQLLIDLRQEKRTGANVAAALEQVGIISNKNGIPGDPYPPIVTSGIRLGTTIVSQRGFDSKDMESIAQWIREIIDIVVTGVTKKNENIILDKAKIEYIRLQVSELCRKYPIEFNL